MQNHQEVGPIHCVEFWLEVLPADCFLKILRDLLGLRYWCGSAGWAVIHLSLGLVVWSPAPPVEVSLVILMITSDNFKSSIHEMLLHTVNKWPDLKAQKYWCCFKNTTRWLCGTVKLAGSWPLLSGNMEPWLWLQPTLSCFLYWTWVCSLIIFLFTVNWSRECSNTAFSFQGNSDAACHKYLYI